ncbi:MAG: chorismate synthase [Saprospirales bacterium]|nr:MAG: chorismate synthase [Saprospirales bacterium]
MASNSFGKALTLTTFGESHGAAIGGILDGMPAGIEYDPDELKQLMQMRRPGQSAVTTSRNEKDEVIILSGLNNGKTNGFPIGFIIPNEDARPKDYSDLKQLFRPSHADFTYREKYGIDPQSGGGRSSARETAIWVAAGYFANLLLKQKSIKVIAYVHSIGGLSLGDDFVGEKLTATPGNIIRCPDVALAKKMEEEILKAKKEGDSLGGTIGCVILNCPTGLGDPIFEKLHAELGKAILTINACKGFEYGSGFAGTKLRGSQHNDEFYADEHGTVKTTTNNSGGIQGGISNGMTIYFKAAFKPTSTLLKSQQTVNLEGKAAEMKAKGRHDPCVLPRAVPVVEAMSRLVIADFLLRNGKYR